MWLEGYSIPQNVEANDYTQEFFEKNESLSKEHTYDPLLVNDPEDNDLMLDHCTNPWLRVDDIGRKCIDKRCNTPHPLRVDRS